MTLMLRTAMTPGKRDGEWQQQSRRQVGSAPNFDWVDFQRFDSDVRGIWESFVNVCTKHLKVLNFHLFILTAKITAV